MTQWTDFRMSDVPPRVLGVLTSRARQQTVDRYGLPEDMFTAAQRLVAEGRVQLTGHNVGLVLDGDWKHVGLSYCAHCDAHTHQVCAHKLSIGFADLLARHLRDHGTRTEQTAADPAATGAGGLGVATGGRLGKAAKSRKGNGDHRHCPECGGWLTASGGCNNCGRGRA